MAERQATCPACHGVIRGTRGVSLEAAIANHAKSCPTELRVRK